MKNKLISVIIPIYNVEKHLDRCIKSLLRQKYKNLEIILVDDGSTDNSGKICDKWKKKDKRIKVIHKKNGGVSSARNIGLDNANGNYITFIDSDDYIEDNTYENIMFFFKKYDVDIVKFQFVKELKNYQKKTNTILEGKIDYSTDKKQILDLFLTKFEFGSVCNSVFKKDVIGNIRFIEDLKFGEDYYFYLNVIFNSKSIYITNDAYYHYVNNDNSATKKFDINKLKISFENHYRVDMMSYHLVANNGYISFKKSCIDCTFSITNILLKSLAYHTNFKKYNKFIQEIKTKDYYLAYRKLAKDYRQKELDNIFNNRIFINYMKFKTEMFIKLIIKKILGRI